MSYENIETREYGRYVTVYIQENWKGKSPNYEIDKRMEWYHTIEVRKRIGR
jgi:hypothetical protein